MEVSCNSCKATYRIDPAILGRRRTTLRCRRCSALIVAEPAKAHPPAPPQPEWFVEIGFERIGPFSSQEIERRRERGDLPAAARVYRADEPTRRPPPLPRRQTQSGLLAASLGPGRPTLAHAAVGAAPGANNGSWVVIAAWTSTAMVLVLGAILLLVREDSLGSRRRRPPAVVQQRLAVGPTGPAQRAAMAPVEPTQPAEPAETTEPPPLAPTTAGASSQPTRWFLPAMAFRIQSADGGQSAGDQAQPDAGVGEQLRGEDAERVVAHKLFRRNQAALLACSRLAERRGELLERRVARFVVVVEPGATTPQVAVDGDGLSERLKGCYRAVVRTWHFPARSRRYQVVFRRRH